MGHKQCREKVSRICTSAWQSAIPDLVRLSIAGNFRGSLALRMAEGLIQMKRILAYLTVLALLCPGAVPAGGAVADTSSGSGDECCTVGCCGGKCECDHGSRNGSESRTCEQSLCASSSPLAILESSRLRPAFDFVIYFLPDPPQQLLSPLFPIDHPPKPSR